MDQQKPPEFVLDVFTDPRSVREVIVGILHTIFFNRFFPSITPLTRDVLDLTLPFVDDEELELMIQARALALERQLEAERASAAARSSASTSSPSFFSPLSSPILALGSPNPNSKGSGTSAAALGGAAGGAAGSAAATAFELGGSGGRGQISVQFFEKRRRKAWLYSGDEEVCWEIWTIKVTVAEPRTESERAKVRRATEQTLLTTVMKIISLVNSNKDHIPPITTQAANPFPFKVTVEAKETSWVARMRIY